MFCRQCGKELAPDSNFCYSCGSPVSSATSVPSRPEPEVIKTDADVATAAAEVPPVRSDMTGSMGEKMVGLVPMLKKPKSFGRWDTYAMVITNRRSLFPQITGKMLKQAMAEAQRKGKEEGKGFFSRWADQFKVSYNFSQRYWDMLPEEILGETPGNFAVENSDIIEIKVNRREEISTEAPGNFANDGVYCEGSTVSQTFTEIKIDAKASTFAYNIDGHADDEVATLRKAFGDRVKA